MLTLIKYGKDSRQKQRYFCKKCNTTKVEFYTYMAYKQDINQNIVSLTKEGVGILSTARLLAISSTTLLKRIKQIASNITQPSISTGKTYEIDEMRSFTGNKNKLIWIVYALEKESKKIVSFNVGARTNKTLSMVIKTVTLSNPKMIYTDKLNNYKHLIENEIHNSKNRATNSIERMNLTLRTHLKRLNRKTIAFSRSIVVLSAILKIYFWG
ncbi:IS1 family transposase [Lacihabitans soyangensis]|uniref:IS1 family transposase n=1 Tax=Lacihabitans soyangensis TaxID=869394 RepID=A0AAE3H761_9BACT|nr:IS1 family transposase [Lacihabitans soyangensis]MCP9765672.1 IS1 family transposase [Lacihabitans soyangensis]